MDQCWSRLKLSENFKRHWSIRISGEIHIDQSLAHTFSRNPYGPMVLKVLLKFPPTLVLLPWMALPSFCASDYLKATKVSHVQGKRQESVGISNRLWTLRPHSTKPASPPRGPFSYPGVSTSGVRHSSVQPLPNWIFSLFSLRRFPCFFTP